MNTVSRELWYSRNDADTQNEGERCENMINERNIQWKQGACIQEMTQNHDDERLRGRTKETYSGSRELGIQEMTQDTQDDDERAQHAHANLHLHMWRIKQFYHCSFTKVVTSVQDCVEERKTLPFSISPRHPICSSLILFYAPTLTMSIVKFLQSKHTGF